MASDIPDPWASAMTKAALLDARFGNPSMSELGRKAGVHTSTVSALILKGKMLSPKNMIAVADALGVSVAEMTKWVTGEIIEPYVPPAGAEHLSHRERHALDELILTMIDRRVKENDDPVDQKKIDPYARVPGETSPVRRRQTPGERRFEESHGLAARFDMDSPDTD